MVRLSSLGKDGRLLRNCLAKALWEDVEARSKQLGVRSNNQTGSKWHMNQHTRELISA